MRRLRAVPTMVGLLGLSLIGASRTMRAQGATLLVRVRVTDSARAPVAGAEVSLVRGLHAVVAQGTTDAAGQRLLIARADSESYDVIVRKIGYHRADRVFLLNGRDTVTLSVVLTRIPQPLAPVRVTARQDAARRAYFIDADEIAASDRTIYSAVDVIEKLRPDMIYGLGGSRVCPSIENVFVNGRRILMGTMAGTMAVQVRQLPRPGKRTDGSGRPPLPMDKYRVPGAPAAILHSIRPEHIAQITYNDCLEKSVKVNRGANAAFVVLKPGVGYSSDEGSYVLGADTTRNARPSVKKP
ncbi:MAG TPA: carboxypeptidase-like regulatory domain-containing protein [Gemmatimonadaceae bacterium]|nr:carboxypeptidase-like regulatory domain-containing protein [Gemmatimonadaceae bacterium]